MNNISCVTLTNEVKNLANKLGCSDVLAVNLVSTWQTINNSLDMPTKEEISKLIKDNKKEAEAGRLAMPNYTTREYTSNKLKLVRSTKGNIELTKLPKFNPLGAFFKKSENAKVKDIVTTPNQAYKYLLWREQGLVSGLSMEDAEQQAIDNLYLSKEIEKENNVIPEIPTPEESTVKKSFGTNLLKDENAVAFAQQQVKNDKIAREKEIAEISKLSELLGNYTEPKIGTDNVELDKTNPILDLNSKFSIQERQDRVELISHLFSDIIDQALSNKLEEIEDSLGNTTDEDEIFRLKEVKRILNDTNEGRKAIINNATLVSLFNKVKAILEESANTPVETYNEMFGEDKGQYIVNSYNKVLDNFYPLLEEAMPSIENKENFRIITNNHKYFAGDKSINVVDGYTATDSQTEGKEDKDFDDDETGKRANGSEGWSVESRFIDPHMSASKSTKKILSNLTREKFDGSVDTDDLGNTRYLDEEYAHAVLINKLSDMIEPNDLDTILSDMSIKYPWVNQIINTLASDDNAKSAFFTDFRKDFVQYYKHGLSTKLGRTASIALNSNTASNSIVSDVVNNYNQGEVLSDNSIYDSGRKLNTTNIEKNKIKAKALLRSINEATKEDYDDISNGVIDLIKSTGIKVNDDTIQSIFRLADSTDKLSEIVNNVIDLLNNTDNMSASDSIVDYGKNRIYYKNIASVIGDYQELDHIQSFRIGDNTRYSYTAPNSINTMFKYLKSPKYCLNYIANEFKKFDWFYNKNTNSWNSEWLNLFENNDSFRRQFTSKEVIDIDGKPYDEWQPMDIKKGFVREFFSVDINPKDKIQYAYYNTPIFSDSPVAMFVKSIRYTGTSEKIEEQLLPKFNKVVRQELERMALVDKRELAGAKKIDSFDKQGKLFNFFPEFNNIMVEDKSLKDYLRSLIDNDDVDALNDTINYYVKSVMDDNFEKYMYDPASDLNMNEDDTLEMLAILHDADVVKDQNDEEAFRNALHDYFWNQAYATTQIIQLAATDLAYFKNDVDFQKRFKESVASGNKLNTNSKYGKENERTIYLIDEEVTSRNFNDISDIINTSVENKRMSLDDANSIKDMFKNISATDAQAFRTLPSMRSLLDMMGLWTDDMQSTMDRLESNQFDANDLNTIWQTIKPFMYTQVSSPNGIGGEMKVPHHNKNSEFLLLAAYDLVSSSLSHSPKMKALNKWMIANNIDVAQYNTAVKVGCQGAIDLRYSSSKLEYYSKAMGLNISNYDEFKSVLDSRLENEEVTQEEYNHIISSISPSEEEVNNLLDSQSKINGNEDPEVIHSLPYKDYIQQQPNPEHVFDAIAVLGSQFKNLIISDISDNPDFRINVRGKKLTKGELKNLYNNILVNEYLDDYKSVTNKFEDIHSLQKALLESVKGNTKYNRDLINALQIIKTKDPMSGLDTEVFNIPLDCPTITDKIQQITNSIFKNKITKQSIKGGACVLVSNIGYTKDLNIIYDKDNKSIKGVECYMPAYTKQFFQPFLKDVKDSNGNIIGKEIDINKIKSMDKNLLNAIGYRIPTEDKYSMLPLIIKDFMPTQNGSSIMLPADITVISGCDFDVDKVFLMFNEFKTFQPYDLEKAKYDFNKENEAIDKVTSSFGHADDEIEVLKETPTFKSWFNEHKDDYKVGDPIITTYKYNMNKSMEDQSENADISRKIRHNLLIDIARAVLTHADTADKILNPGNFSKLENIAGISSIITNEDLLTKWVNSEADLMIGSNTFDSQIDTIAHSIDIASPRKISSFIKNNKAAKTQLTPDTFIYNHRQNMTGGALIGIYANNTTLQAKFQDSDLSINDAHAFTINGVQYDSLHDIYSKTGERISKNCANFSAASVDNVKNPVLDKIMQNTKTAKVACTMLRAGVPIKEIGLLFSTPIVRQCIFNTGALDSKDFDLYIMNKVTEYTKKYGKNPSLNMESVLAKGVNTIDIIKSIVANKAMLMSREPSANISYNPIYQENSIKAAMLMKNIIAITDTLNDATSISRADSPNSAMKPSISGLINQINKVNMYNPAKTLTGTNVFVNNTAKLTPSTSEDTMRKVFMTHSTPMLEAAYSLGIRFGYDLMSKYYNKLNGNQKLINSLYGYTSKGRVADTLMTSFLRDLTTYRLSSTKLFGDDTNSTYDEKRDYYLYVFPQKFLDLKLHNTDIAKLGIIKKMTIVDGKIGLMNSGRLSNMSREAYMKDFDTLLYSSNPAMNKLAVDLLMYSYYKEGLSFGPNNYGYFFSSVFLSSFPEITNALRDNTPVATNFMDQFISNNSSIVPGFSTKAASKYDLKSNEDGSISLLSEYVTSVFGEKYPYIRIDGSLYTVDFSNDTRAYYYPAYTINDEAGSRYNANSEVSDLATHTTDINIIKANKLIGSSIMSTMLEDNKIHNMANAFDMDDDTYSNIVDSDTIDGVENSDISNEYEDFDDSDIDMPNLDDFNLEDSQKILDEPLCR